MKGTLLVDAHQFEMKAQLGFLFGAFKDRIESEIGEQLDALLNAPQPAAKKVAPKKKAADDVAPAKTAAAKAPAKAKKA